MPAHTLRLLTERDLTRLVIELNPVLGRTGRADDAAAVARVMVGTVNEHLRTGLMNPNPMELESLGTAYLQAPGHRPVPRCLRTELYVCAELAVAAALGAPQ